MMHSLGVQKLALKRNILLNNEYLNQEKLYASNSINQLATGLVEWVRPINSIAVSCMADHASSLR